MPGVKMVHARAADFSRPGFGGSTGVASPGDIIDGNSDAVDCAGVDHPVAVR